MFEPPRFMSASDAANQLLEIIKRRENDGQPLKGNKSCLHSIIKVVVVLQDSLQILNVLVLRGLVLIVNR